jgi:hypothetical protein
MVFSIFKEEARFWLPRNVCDVSGNVLLSSSSNLDM